MRYHAWLAVFIVSLTLSRAACAIESAAIAQISPLQFGALARPLSGTQTYTIPANGGSATGTGALLYGTPMRGQYRITTTGTGGGFTSYTIDIRNVNSGNAAVTISAFTGVYDGTAIASFPRVGLPKAGNAGKTLYIGATATYTSSVPNAAITPGFDIVVTLQ